MCLHAWGGDVAINPPHHLRAGVLFCDITHYHITRPAYSGPLVAYYKRLQRSGPGVPAVPARKGGWW